MTSDQRSAEGLAEVAAPLEAPAPPFPVIEPVDVPMLESNADLPISIPTDFDDEHAYFVQQARIRRRELARRHQQMARLRLYSYFMTLAACVFALMTFMYLVQGQGDGDATFLSLGALFGAATIFLLWAAVRVTHVANPDHDF